VGPEAREEPEEERLGAPLPIAPVGPKWTLPRLEEILDPGEEVEIDEGELREKARIIEETLRSLGVEARVVEVQRGPTVTLFGLEPGQISRGGRATRVKVAQIAALADDLALALSARTVRVLAPIPGRGLVGIEIPNERPALVRLRDVMESEAYRALSSPLRLPLGQTVSGEPLVADLTAMPHLLIAGATGSGKSVALNAILVSLLCTCTPEDLRLILIDPKRVELTPYNGIPHLWTPVVVEIEKVPRVLQEAMREMERRYRQFAAVGVRHIADYNRRMAERGEPRIPYLVIVVDELADLMITAPEGDRAADHAAGADGAGDGDSSGDRHAAAERGRGDGADQGELSGADCVCGGFVGGLAGDPGHAGGGDVAGAGRYALPAARPGPAHPRPGMLRLRRGDPTRRDLLEGHPGPRPTGPERRASPVRVPRPAPEPVSEPPVREPEEEEDHESDEVLLQRAIEIVRLHRRASISLLQRKLRIGYNRAARLIDLMEARGWIGPPEEGSRWRGLEGLEPPSDPGEDS
jgi:S-DNA-T family DNA segregation ATPase FtsK/SpoIIIE